MLFLYLKTASEVQRKKISAWLGLALLSVLMYELLCSYWEYCLFYIEDL